jgi:cytochrome P450
MATADVRPAARATPRPDRMPDPGPRPAFPGPKAFVADIRMAKAAVKRRPVPRGDTNFSLVRTWRARHDVLELLLESYYKYGPIYGIKIMHDRSVFMIGPEANHFVLVSGRENFVWRHGRLGDLITLIGDGLLTTDGDYHDTSRAIMMPSFHRDRVVASVETMVAEAEAAAERLEPGQTIDIFHWTRELAMRIAMQALFGFDADSARAGETATHFEEGLSFHGAEFVLQLLVGPGTPYAKLKRSRAALERTIGEEIIARRRSGEDRGDVLGSLLAATDEHGAGLSDKQVLDHVMTLLFAGHDTTTSTVTFMAYELARNPDWMPRLANHIDTVVGEAATPSAEQLFGEMPLLSQAVDETLRLYPPAWIGPRRTVADFEFNGVEVPAGLPVSYSSWVSHHLPDVWEQPYAFRPERFEPERRAKLPRGAYVPFGMGPRVCIGKRFGYTEVHAIAAALLRRFEFSLPEGEKIKVEQSPTLSPKGGLPVLLHARS